MSFVVPADSSALSRFTHSDNALMAGMTFGADAIDRWDALGIDVEFIDATLCRIDDMFIDARGSRTSVQYITRKQILTSMFDEGRAAFIRYEDSGHTVDELTKTYALLLSMVVSIDKPVDLDNLVLSIEVLGHVAVRDLLIANVELSIIANGARNDVDASLLMSVVK